LNEVEVGKGKEANEKPSPQCSTEEKGNSFVEQFKYASKEIEKKSNQEVKNRRRRRRRRRTVNGGRVRKTRKTKYKS